MEISDVEAALCIRALGVAARARADDVVAARFRELGVALFERYAVGPREGLSADEAEALGFDSTLRFD